MANQLSSALQPRNKLLPDLRATIFRKTAVPPTKRRPFPYVRVAKLWTKGRTIAEIAKAIDRVGAGKDPHHGLRVVLTRMHKGYKGADGKLVKLPYRVTSKTLKLATAAGKKSGK
jgi:hypothetical protein